MYLDGSLVLAHIFLITREMAPTPQHLRSGGGKSEDVIFVILCSGSYGAKRRKGQNRPILRPPGFPSVTQPPPTLLAGTIDELDIKKEK